MVSRSGDKWVGDTGVLVWPHPTTHFSKSCHCQCLSRVMLGWAHHTTLTLLSHGENISACSPEEKPRPQKKTTFSGMLESNKCCWLGPTPPKLCCIGHEGHWRHARACRRKTGVFTFEGLPSPIMKVYRCQLLLSCSRWGAWRRDREEHWGDGRWGSNLRGCHWREV